MAFIITSKSRGGATKPRSGPNTRFDQGFRNEFGLVGAWTLDSGIYRSWDLSGVGNHARLVDIDGTVFNTRSTHGNALKFTGNASYDRLTFGDVTSANPLSLAGIDVCTIAFRARIRSGTLTNGSARVIDKSSAGNGLNGWASLYQVATDEYMFAHSGSGVFITSNAPARAVWENRAVTRNGGSGAWYLDGVDDTVDSTPAGGQFSSTTTEAAIGNWNHDKDRAWDGDIDYVYVFNKDIPQSIIARLASHPYEWIASTPKRTYFLPPAATTDSVFIITSKSRARIKLPIATRLSEVGRRAASVWTLGEAGGNVVNLTTGAISAWTNATNLSNVVTPIGRATSQVTGTGYVDLASGGTPVDGTPWSVMVLFRTANSGIGMLLGGESQSGQRYSQFRVNSGVAEGIAFNVAPSTATATGTSTVNDGLLHCAMVRMRGGSALPFDIVVDGVIEDSVTGPGDPVKMVPTFRFFDTQRDSKTPLVGEIALAACWNYALSDAEAIRLTADPLEIFYRQRRTYFIPAAAGGGGFQSAWAASSNTLISNGITT